MYKLLSILILSQISWNVVLSGTGRMAGGWTDVDVSQDSVKNVTNFAVDMYNRQSNSIHVKQLVTIKSAKSQVVSGRKFIITFTIGETDCSKNGIQKNTINECLITETGTIETCSATIWQRVWLNSTILQNIKCCPSDTTECQ